ncbi:hypothetical protein [Gluconobacter sphaericus]|uniref:hypothetical protein n=1 Tax=Gluconobacter sphaericus TaxID=574987 RepID=UPI00312B769B
MGKSDRPYLELALRYPPGGLKSRENITRPNPTSSHLCMYWNYDPPAEIRDNIHYRQEPWFTIFNHETAMKWLCDYYGKKISKIFRKVRHPAEGANLRIRSREVEKKLTTGSIKDVASFPTAP